MILLKVRFDDYSDLLRPGRATLVDGTGLFPRWEGDLVAGLLNIYTDIPQVYVLGPSEAVESAIEQVKKLDPDAVIEWRYPRYKLEIPEGVVI